MSLVGTESQAGTTPAAAPAVSGSTITAPAAPAAAPSVTGATDWKASLPEDIRSAPSIQNFKDISDLAKSYVHAQGKIGAKGVFVPGEKASDEEWGKYFKEIGVPDLEKYNVTVPKEANADFVNKFKEIAAKGGLLPRQAQGLIEWYMKQEKEQITNFTQSRNQEREAHGAKLKKELGDSYDVSIKRAQNLVKEVGGEEMQQHLLKTGMASDPILTGFIVKLAKMNKEESLRGGDDSTSGNTPEEIDNRITEMFSDPAYLDASHPGHKTKVAEFVRLNKMKTGGM